MDNSTLRSQLNLVPLPVRSWFASEEVDSMIETINQHFGIQGEFESTIPKLLFRLEVKDLAPDYFSGELSEELKIDRDKALGISGEIQRTILSPMKKEFSGAGIDITLLDKFQIPIIKGLAPSTSLSSGPTILKDIGPVVNAPSPRPQPISIATATATSRSVSAAPSISSVAIPNANIPPAAPKTNRLSDVGWSRSGASDPVIKLDISPASRAAVAPTAPTPAPKQQNPAPQQASASSTNHTLGEFERLNAMKKTPVAPTPTQAAPSAPTPPRAPAAPRPATPSGDPAPFILHQDSSFKSQEKNSAFTLPKPEAEAHIQMNAVRPPAPVRPAVLEFGQANGQTPAKPAAAAPAPSKVIHYTEFGAPLSSMPTANTGPRTVSEIAPVTPQPTASIPVPTPPRPPMPPTPPRAPAQPVQSSQQQSQPAQQEKVIVKDFL